MQTEITEMYAGRAPCCPMVRHIEYALKGQADRRSQDFTLHFHLDAASGKTNKPKTQ